MVNRSNAFVQSLISLLLLAAGCAGADTGDPWGGNAPTVGSEAVPLACSAVDPEAGFVEGDSAGVSIVLNAAPAWRNAEVLRPADSPHVTIGVVDGDPMQQFGSVGTVRRLPDGRIVVADGQAREIRVFDADGGFILRFGGRGSGPGEFMQIWGLYVVGGDTLLVTSRERFTLFTTAGELVGTAPFEPVRLEFPPAMPGGAPIEQLRLPTVIQAFRDGKLLVAVARGEAPREEITEVRRPALTLYRMSLDAQLLDSVGVALGATYYEYWPGDGSVWFGPEPYGTVLSIAVAADRFYVGAGDRFLVDEHAADGRLLRRIVLCEDPEPITEELYDEYVRRAIEPVSPEFKAREEEAFRNIPRRTHAAAHLEMFIDSVERLWVRALTHIGEPPRWKLFDRTGRWLGDIEVRSGLEVLDAGSDWVLGRATDELGVQRVRLHSLPLAG